MPPLALPPSSLQVHRPSGVRVKYAFPLRTWAAFVTLFILGTVVTFLVQR